MARPSGKVHITRFPGTPKKPAQRWYRERNSDVGPYVPMASDIINGGKLLQESMYPVIRAPTSWYVRDSPSPTK
jgi:hypothetical protein